MNTDDGHQYRAGTLAYSRAGLVILFAWLLWGDFCYVLMEQVVPTILPLKLKSLGTPNWLMGMILTTIPCFFNMTICPWISFKSDRYRSKWGRRIPFIVGTMPFLCICLVLLGCSDSISVFLQKHLVFLSNTAPATITITLIAIFMAMFQFFNMFVASVFYYLFNDVVPAQFLSRFCALFRIIGTLAGAAYNFFIFQYAESHMREIFIGAAVLYMVGFGLVCLKVKEGGSPPIEGETASDNKGIGGLKTFFRECFTHKFYWVFFMCFTLSQVTATIWTYGIFFQREMGLSLDNIGKFQAIAGLVTPIALYFAAIYVDRWHPMRVYVYLQIFTTFSFIGGWVWVFVTLPGNFFFWLSFGSSIITVFQGAMAGACEYPLTMRSLPKSRFGQFSSARAIVISLFRMFSGVAAGLFVDLCGMLFGAQYTYRLFFIWSIFFGVLTAACCICLYIYWYRLGGDDNFHPPAPWSPNQKEEMEVVPTVCPQSRWLKISFNLFNAIMALSVFGLPVMMWWMYRNNAMHAFKWFAFIIIPLSLATWFCWKMLEKGIRRDMERAVKNQPLKNGIPHHGILMVVSIKYLLAISVWVAQIIITVNLNMETGALVFGINNVVTNLMLIAAVWLICRMERGYSTTIDVKHAAT